MSRIPKLTDNSASAMFLWWCQMAAAGLAFHPDDGVEEVGNYVDGRWVRTFTDDEAVEANEIVHGGNGMHATHGDLIYTAARQATEAPDITAARERTIADWDSPDISASPYAEVEKVEGGYWVEARIWCPSHN